MLGRQLTSSMSAEIPGVLFAISARLGAGMYNPAQSCENSSSEKASAKEFLRRLATFLNDSIPPRTATRKILDDVVRAAKASSDKRYRHLAFPEGAFLNTYAVPLIHHYLTNSVGLTEDDGRQALLSESYRRQKGIASGSPASKQKHPFTKSIGENLQSIIGRWWNDDGEPVASQSCPDLALRSPCPHKIVFEGKYFRENSARAAKSSLVRDIYQCFFYLGLPRVSVDRKHAAWDYDYASLLAFDASADGVLVSAWQEISEKVGASLWQGANIFVMVLGRNA